MGKKQSVNRQYTDEFKGKAGMGHVTTRSAVLSFPFKEKAGMGHVTTRSAVLSFPFKGKAGMGMGMGALKRKHQPIPALALPLKGREYRISREALH